MVKPFRVSCAYIYWAHQSASESGPEYSSAIELMQIHDATKRDYILVPADRADLVREIVDVAELYVGGRDSDLRAARVLNRARQWLKDNHA